MYRYAEVLLIAAEAIARSEGVTSEAISYLTDVRGRAYWQTDRGEIESYPADSLNSNLLTRYGKNDCVNWR